jgi:hypothetical protein
MPVKFTLFPWENLPSENTPFDRETAQALETRLSKFTEEYEVHWLEPVATHAALLALSNPEGGDVRLVIESLRLYGYDDVAKEWKSLSSWQAPVADKAALEALTDHEPGDARLIEETREVFCYVEGEWQPIFVTGLHAHFITGPTWAIAEKVTEGTVPGGFFRLGPGETKTLTEIEFELVKGKAEFELMLNGVALKFEGGSTKVKAKTAAEALKLESPTALGDKDKLTLVCTTIESTPEGLALTAFIEHVATVA